MIQQKKKKKGYGSIIALKYFMGWQKKYYEVSSCICCNTLNLKNFDLTNSNTLWYDKRKGYEFNCYMCGGTLNLKRMLSLLIRISHDLIKKYYEFNCYMWYHVKEFWAVPYRVSIRLLRMYCPI